MSTKADRRLSSLAGLGIILVVFGHSGPSVENLQLQAANGTLAFLLHQIFAWIYTFHMPLFFAMAGYAYVKFTAKRRQAMLPFLLDKAERLLLPYIVLSSIAFPLKALLSRYAQRPIEFGVFEYGKQLLFPWQNVILAFWFLPTLFLMLILCKLILQRSPGSFWYWIVLLASGLTCCLFPSQKETGWGAVLNCCGVLHNFVFAWIGAVIARFQGEELIKRFGYWFAPISVAVFTLGHRIENISFVVMMMSILGLVAAWSFVSHYDSKVLYYLGNWSYTIYLLSWFPQVGCRFLTDHVLHSPLAVNVLSMFLTGIIIPVAAGVWLQQRDWRVIQKICGVPLAAPKRPAMEPVNASDLQLD